MAKNQVIREIRFYPDEQDTTCIPTPPNSLSARIAQKLREYSFSLSAFDHLYIIFTNRIEDGQTKPSDRGDMDWFRYVDHGLPSKIYERLSKADQEQRVNGRIFQILRSLVGDDPEKLSIIAQVENEVATYGSQLEILHSVRDLAASKITITFQINPNGNTSVGLIKVEDKASGQIVKGKFIDLVQYEDLFPLVGTVSLSKGIVTIKPRPSCKAGLFAEPYKTPIIIDLAKLQ